jgi:hypothetical protein
MRRNVGGPERRTTDRSTPRSKDRNAVNASHNQSQSPKLQAAVYDVSEMQVLPDTHTRRPSVRSWSSLRPSIYDEDEDISPRTCAPPSKKKVYSPVSPPRNNYSTWHNTSTSPIDTVEARNNSDATLFPSFPTAFKKPDTKAIDARGMQPPRNLADFFRTAKEIYDVGPRGEGQKLWSSYKQFRKGQREIAETRHENMEVPAHRRPSAPGLSAHPPDRPPPSEIRLAARKAVPVTDTLNTHKKSQISTSSFEVPIHIDPGIHFTDPSKPLPPIPRLQAAPRTREHGDTNLSKPLPTLPTQRSYPDRDASKSFAQSLQPQSVPRYKARQGNKPTKSHVSKEHVSTAASNVKYSQGQSQPANVSSSHTKHNNKASHWWKTLAEKTSEDYVPTSRNKGKASTDKLKGAISRPRPFTALQNGLTANVAAECGGVGGPGAAHARLSDRQKGKQKATPMRSPVGMHFPSLWRDKLTYASDSAGKPRPIQSKRRDSDMSFACAGVQEDYSAYMQDPGPSRQRVGDEGMEPEPLFSGTRGEVRDTQFYDPYHDVLDEYRR